MAEASKTAAPKRVIVLGATSAIAEAACRIWAKDGARLVIAGRGLPRLDAIAADLRVRGGSVTAVELDLAAAEAAPALQSMVDELGGGVDVVLLAYGVLDEQAQLEADPASAARHIQTNFVSAAAWCLAASAILERQRSGALLVLGSVAGDRGRQSNFIYGSTKSALACLVEGIAHKLAPLGARAVVLKPGFVDTPMTAAFKKGALWSKPDAIAPIIVRSAERGGPVVYVPGFWRWIMLVIRACPAFVFNKLRI